MATYRQKQLSKTNSKANSKANVRQADIYKEDKDKEDKEDIDKEKDKKSIGEKEKRFSPPSPEEVKNYCKERNNTVDAEQFIDFYTSKKLVHRQDKNEGLESGS